MEEEIRLKNQIERIRKDINRLEVDKKKKFQEGIGSDLIKKKMHLRINMRLVPFFAGNKLNAYFIITVISCAYSNHLTNDAILID